MIDCMLTKNKFKDFFQKTLLHYNRKAGLFRLFMLFYVTCTLINSFAFLIQNI
jgi:hypothetical protein